MPYIILLAPFGSAGAVNSIILWHKKKVEPSSYLILSVGLGLPCNTDKENEQAPLGCISYLRNTNQEERSSHYSDITSAC